jgi:hypothetical protein
MSDAPKAVFLSYAREDAAAARRIADALRAFGVEVWFDENELRGGDAWDQKIKQQIRDCALFLAIVSLNTQTRREGYFRREWKLAAERTHDMAGGAAFLVPVGIDDTPQAAAVVPEEFLKVQWTRATHGVAAPEFVRQVQRLLSAPVTVAAGDARKPSSVPPDAAKPRPAPKSLWALVVATTIIVAAVTVWKTRHAHAPGTPGVPVIVLMDSAYPNRVYDPVTLKSGGTNADDITEDLRDLPVALMKEATSSTWRREAEVVKERPALIVIHRSAFYTFPDSMAEDIYPLADNKLVAFLGYVATLNPDTKFIVYSRHSWDADAMASKWRAEAVNRFPVLAGRLETWRVPLDRATFRNPVTGQELRASVERALGFTVGRAAQE